MHVICHEDVGVNRTPEASARLGEMVAVKRIVILVDVI
jgi:hypothetical protein